MRHIEEPTTQTVGDLIARDGHQFAGLGVAEAVNAVHAIMARPSAAYERERAIEATLRAAESRRETIVGDGDSLEVSNSWAQQMADAGRIHLCDEDGCEVYHLSPGSDWFDVQEPEARMTRAELAELRGDVERDEMKDGRYE